MNKGCSPEPPGVAGLGKYCLTDSRPVFCLSGLSPAGRVAHHPGRMSTSQVKIDEAAEMRPRSFILVKAHFISF